jgi:hypothetical protein
LHACAVWPRAVRAPVSPAEARASSATKTETVGVEETVDDPRWVMLEGVDTPVVPVCANEPTRRRDSPDAPTDSAWM